MFKYIIWAIILYCLIRFVFNFIIPVFRATRQMRKQVKEFQEKMQGGQPMDQPFSSRASASPDSSATRSTAPKEGDYIDFEEIR